MSLESECLRMRDLGWCPKSCGADEYCRRVIAAVERLEGGSDERRDVGGQQGR